MYNSELKNRFLEQYAPETARVYKDSLSKIEESEEFYEKDIFNFTYEQLDNAFKGISAKTLSGVRRIVSPVLEYIRWANKNGFIKSKIDITDLFSGEKLKSYIWKYANNNSYIFREELYDMCEHLENDVDKALLVIVFEGIKGKEHGEMLNLKYPDIDFTTGKTRVVSIDGEVRFITITDKRSLDILEASRQQTIYKINNGVFSKSKREEFELADTPYVIRKMRRNLTQIGYDDDEKSTIGFILAKVTRIFKGKRDANGKIIGEPFLLDAQFLNLNTIYKSGFFDFCKTMESKKGNLVTFDYYNACVRYGINPQLLQDYKSQYLNWKA